MNLPHFAYSVVGVRGGQGETPYDIATFDTFAEAMEAASKDRLAAAIRKDRLKWGGREQVWWEYVSELRRTGREPKA